MKILAVNPWVYDFTYYDLYAKPYGLLILASLLAETGHDVKFIDLCNAENFGEQFATKRKSDGTGSFYKELVDTPHQYSMFDKGYHRFGLPVDVFRNILEKCEKPDIVIITSVMTYWYLGVNATIKLIKQVFPDVSCYLGGIYATLLPDHAQQNSGADVVITGNASNFFDRVLGKKLNKTFILPRLELFYKKLNYIPILTSYGCPFNCDYCASKSIYRGNMEHGETSECLQYIIKYTERYKTDIVAFYDDALLYNKENHIFKLLQSVIEAGIKLKFYTPNGLHIRFIDGMCAELLMYSGFQKLRLSLEFTQNNRYDSKTSLKEFETAIKRLHNVGFKQHQLGVYLLCGVPGQTKEELKQAIDYVYDVGGYPYLSEYSPVPGSKLYEKIKSKCKYDLSEPLYHNNSILPLESENFSYSDFLELKMYNRQKRKLFS